MSTSPDDKNLSDDEISHTDKATAANSDDENTDGYCLIPQDPDNNQDDEEDEDEEINEDDEFLRFATLRVLSSTDDDDNKNNPPIDLIPYPTESIWTPKLESESFPVDDDKANYIKTLMSSIELPESSVPVWAHHCPEEDWKEKLREQITCRQTTFFSKDNK
jgi:hypothetical protein